MSAGPRVLLLTLSERTSGKGNAYLSGWLGRASVVAFRGEDDKHGNPTWDLFVSTPEPRAEDRKGERRAFGDPADRTAATHVSPAPGGAPAKPSASPVARGDGWRGSQYRRPANGARRGATADGAPFYDDDLADVGRR